LSGVTAGGDVKLYVFDSENMAWMQEDDLNVVQFAYYEGYLYALASDKKIYKFGAGAETFNWEIETAEFTEAYFGKKLNTDISLRVELGPESSLSVHIKTDGGIYQEVKSVSNENNKQMHHIFIPSIEYERMQIKLSGHGTARIYGIGRNVTLGSDKL